MESLIFVTEKRDGSVKARTCANGSTQRGYIDRDQAASPTAVTDAIIITGVIEAKQRRDVMVSDVPNAFVQTKVPTTNVDGKPADRIIMKIRGILVDMLVDMNPTLYAPYVIEHGNNKVLYVQMLMALYGMLIASLLYYKQFVRDIKTIGFVLNPYDPCVANRTVYNKQHTICWHVDDIKSSHVQPKVNDEFHIWLRTTYGQDGIGEVKSSRGLRHDYLAMIFDYSVPGSLRLDMCNYVKSMIHDFPYKIKDEKYPWNQNMFKVYETEKDLGDDRRQVFHTFVMKGMFVCKRASQDIAPGIAFLSTRTKSPNEGDWRKLLKLLGFMKRTQDDVATLEADDAQRLSWHVDVSFAVHADLKSHTGATFTMGKGCVTSACQKQKVNTRSTTEAELVGLDDVLSKIIWTLLFVRAQGFHVLSNVVHRDNTSTMKLEQNGKESSGRRTRHFDIKYFYATDLIRRKLLKIEYCPTDQMVADYTSKPTMAALFRGFRNLIMNFDQSASRSVLEYKNMSSEMLD